MIAINGHDVPQGPAAAAWARMPFLKLKVEGDATLSHVRSPLIARDCHLKLKVEGDATLSHASLLR